MSFCKATYELAIDAGEVHDALAQLGAAIEGRRYWTDHKGQPRRMPGKKPILSHGRKPR